LPWRTSGSFPGDHHPPGSLAGLQQPLGRAKNARSAHSDSVNVLRRGRFFHGNRSVPVFKVRVGAVAGSPIGSAFSANDTSYRRVPYSCPVRSLTPFGAPRSSRLGHVGLGDQVGGEGRRDRPVRGIVVDRGLVDPLESRLHDGEHDPVTLRTANAEGFSGVLPSYLPGVRRNYGVHKPRGPRYVASATDTSSVLPSGRPGTGPHRCPLRGQDAAPPSAGRPQRPGSQGPSDLHRTAFQPWPPASPLITGTTISFTDRPAVSSSWLLAAVAPGAVLPLHREASHAWKRWGGALDARGRRN